jgi:hypothetical protein
VSSLAPGSQNVSADRSMRSSTRSAVVARCRRARASSSRVRPVLHQAATGTTAVHSVRTVSSRCSSAIRRPDVIAEPPGADLVDARQHGDALTGDEPATLRSKAPELGVADVGVA